VWYPCNPTTWNHHQGDEEKKRGFVVSPNCDRAAKTRIEIQKGFIDFVIVVPAPAAKMWSGSEEGSYPRLIDFCISQL